MSAEWYTSKDGKGRVGPYTLAQLKSLADAGQLLPTQGVWRQGMPKDLPASAIKGLFATTGASHLGRLPAVPAARSPGPGVLGLLTVALTVLLALAAAGLAVGGVGGKLLGPLVAGMAMCVGVVAIGMGLARRFSLLGPAVTATMLGCTALLLSLGLLRPPQAELRTDEPPLAVAQLEQAQAALAQEQARAAEAVAQLEQQRQQFEQDKAALERRARDAEASVKASAAPPPLAKEPEPKTEPEPAPAKPAPAPVPAKPAPEPEKKPPAPQDNPKKPTAQELQASIKAYVSATEAERPALLKALAQHEDLQKADLKTWFDFTWAEIQKQPRCGPGLPKTLQHPRFPIRYNLSGQPRPGEPLVIFLHGGGNNAKLNDTAWQSAGGRGLGFPCVAAPRVFDDSQPVGWWEDSAVVSVVAMLDELKRTYQIDTNRVFLGGYSMGGFGAPLLGSLLADRWAGVFSLAGGSTGFEPYPNLRNTPFAIHIGDADKANGRLTTSRRMRDLVMGLQEADKDGYKLNYKEYPGTGHLLPPGAEVELGQWFRQFKREPYPKTLVWKPMKDSQPLFHWLRIGPGQVPPTSRRINIQQNQLVDAPIVRARIEGNQVSIETGGVRGFTIFLNDALVDLSQPVTVVVDGKEAFNGKVPYKLMALVETLTAKEDANMYFTARLDFRR